MAIGTAHRRLLAPLVRAVMRGGLRKAMDRLAVELAQLDATRSAA